MTGCEIQSNICVCRKTGGTGCPETDGGAHYYAHIDPTRDGRICIDCGAPEHEEVAL